MFKLAPCAAAAVAPPSRPSAAGPGTAAWPLQQLRGGASANCRVQRQPAGCSVLPQSAAEGARRATQQQQVPAGEMLERAAAAVRPASSAPADSTASGSSSHSSSSSSSSHAYVQRTARHAVAAEYSSLGLASPDVLRGPAAAAAAAAALADSSASDCVVAAGMQQCDTPVSPPASSNGHGVQQQQQSSSSSSSSSSSAGPPHSPLMQQIRKQCHSCEDVAELFRDRSEHFEAAHCAAALYQLASLWQQLLQQTPLQAQLFSHASTLQQELAQMQQLGSTLLRALSACMPQAQLRDIADAWYAADTLGLLQNDSTAAAAASAAAANGTGSHSSNATAGAAAAAAAQAAAAPANAAFVTASLQHSSHLLRQSHVQLRDLSRLLTSFADLGINPGLDWWAAALDAAAGGMEQVLQQPVPIQGSVASGSRSQWQHQQQQWDDGSSGSSSSSPAAIASHVNAQAVALIGWAVAKLQAPASTAWWQLFHAASAHLMPVMFASQLCNCIYASACTQQTPDAAWMEAFYRSCSRSWGHFKPQGFASVLWSLVVLQQQPSRDWLAGLDAAFAAKLPRASLQHLGMALWSMARLQQAAAACPAVVQQQQQQPYHQQQQQQQPYQQQQQQQLGGLLQMPSPAWQEQAWAQLSRLDVDAQAPQGLACVLWGIVRLQLQVPQPRMQELEGMCVESVRGMGPQALAVVCWALGNLRGAATSRRLLRLVRSRCMQEPELLQQLPPQGMCMLLSGLAQMNAWHPDSFKQQLLDAVTAQLPAPTQQQDPQRQRRRQQHQQQKQRQDSGPGNSGCSSSSVAVLQAESLPLVLLHLRRLWVAVPADTLCRVELALQQSMQTLPAQSLCLGLFALAACKHAADAAFLTAALARLESQLQSCSGLDAAHVLYSLAVMSARDGGDLRQVLQQPDQQAQLHRLVARVEQVLPGGQLDHRALAMLMWALGRLQLQPSESFLQSVMAATLQAMPGMSLLSVVSILGAFRALHYLPPLPWMVEVCSAARRKVSADASSTSQVWQQRASVRRFEETVGWYNQALQEQAAAVAGSSSSGGSSRDGSVEDASVDGEGDGPGVQRRRARLALLAAAEKSEAVLAAAVGIAAAVAQRWHP